MDAILLFSAVLHVGALALAMAHVMAGWHRDQGATEPESVRAAIYFGLAVGLVAAVLMRIGHAMGQSLATGIVAGLIAGLLLALIGQVRPTAPSLAGEHWHTRPHILVFYGTFALLEVVAVAFLVAALTGSVGR